LRDDVSLFTTASQARQRSTGVATQCSFARTAS
jgi:hypothetical protein